MLNLPLFSIPCTMYIAYSKKVGQSFQFFALIEFGVTLSMKQISSFAPKFETCASGLVKSTSGRYVAYLANMYSRKIFCKKLAFFSSLRSCCSVVRSLAAKEFVRVNFFNEKKQKLTFSPCLMLVVWSATKSVYSGPSILLHSFLRGFIFFARTTNMKQCPPLNCITDN